MDFLFSAMLVLSYLSKSGTDLFAYLNHLSMLVVDGAAPYFTMPSNVKNMYKDAIWNLMDWILSLLSLVYKGLQRLSSHLTRQLSIKSKTLNFPESGTVRSTWITFVREAHLLSGGKLSKSFQFCCL